MNGYFCFLVISVLISSFSQVLLKVGANKKYNNVIREYLNVWVISGYFLLAISTLCVIFAYSRGVDYINGAIVESLGYILIMIWGRLFFKEKITVKKFCGNVLILLGVLVFYIQL